MNKFISKLIIAIDNSHVTKVILTPIFVILLIIVFDKLGIFIEYLIK